MVEGCRASEALREGAGASNLCSTVGELGWALVEGVDGWHRSMVGCASGDDLGVGVGGELSWGGGAGSPLWAMFC